LILTFFSHFPFEVSEEKLRDAIGARPGSASTLKGRAADDAKIRSTAKEEPFFLSPMAPNQKGSHRGPGMSASRVRFARKNGSLSGGKLRSQSAAGSGREGKKGQETWKNLKFFLEE
jgi:hypothetical protein